MSTCQNFTKLCQNEATKILHLEYPELDELMLCTCCFYEPKCIICRREADDCEICATCYKLYYTNVCVSCDTNPRIDGWAECEDCGLSPSVPVGVEAEDLKKYEKLYNKKKLAAKLNTLV